MSKRIGITYDLKTDWPVRDDDPKDLNAEFDAPEVLEFIIQAIEDLGHTVVRIGHAKGLLSQIDQLDVDIVLNICEGYYGRNRESQVPMLLEMYGLPYIGADALSLGITLDKQIAKKCFMADDIPTPRSFVADDSQDLKRLNTIGFPLIVKTLHEGSSKGLSENSRVEDYAGLKRQVDWIHQTYQQPALVEEFVKGTEFTVAVLGNKPPEAMPVVQVSIDGQTNLGDQFYTFNRIASDALQYICPAKISPEFEQQLKDLAVRVYKSVGCRDFGRVDFRVDEEGRPFVLEINPLPCLAKEDIFNIFPQTMGLTYTDIMGRIINDGLERYGLKDSGQSSAVSDQMLKADR